MGKWRWARVLWTVVRSARAVEFRVRGELYALLIRANGGSCGRNLTVGRRLFVKHSPQAGWTIGDNVWIGHDVVLDVEPSATLEIASRTKITGCCYIGASGGVSVGEDGLIAEFVSIRDSNHGLLAGVPISIQPTDVGEVRIGRDVWIGRGSAIIKGACVADGAVIAANSVVRAQVLPLEIVAGVPAKPIGRRRT